MADMTAGQLRALKAEQGRDKMAALEDEHSRRGAEIRQLKQSATAKVDNYLDDEFPF